MNSNTVKHLILEANYASRRIKRPFTPAEFIDVLADDRKYNNYINTFITGVGMSPMIAEEFRQVSNNLRKYLLEQTVVGNISYYETLTFPILSVFYPRLIARELVTVTPISKPEIIKAFVKPKFRKGNNLYDAPVTTVDVSRGPGSNSVYTATFAGNTVVNLYDLATPPIGDMQATIQRGTVSIIKLAKGDQEMPVNIYPTVDGTFAATLDLTPIGGPAITELTGSIDYKTGKTVISVSSQNGQVDGVTVTLAFVLGFEYNVRNPEIEFEVEKITLRVTDRQITARWSLQFEQDLRALYDLDLQSQLVTIIGEQIALDIDREIINHLIAITSSIPQNLEHTYNFYLQPSQNFTFGYKEWNKQVVLSLERLASNIYRDTNIQAGNIIAINTNDMNVFTSLDDFYFTYENNYLNAGIGFAEATIVGGKFKVLVSPIVPQGKVLVTYKPDVETKVVYYYCPYIPAVIHPYPLSNMPTLTFLTRYAVAPVRPLGLARLDLNNNTPPPNWRP